MGEVMNIEVLSERDAEAVILPIPAAAALPDAPLAMPTQRLEAPQPVAFLLWGKSAEAKAALIGPGRHLVLTAAHPSPLSARRGFFGCGHFSKANDWLAAEGAGRIDWRLP